MVVVTITDDGAGMNDDTRLRANKPFFTARTIGQGVGLGPSLAGGFVRHVGGTLLIDSASGVGTTVTLTLPCMVTTGGSDIRSDPSRAQPQCREWIQ